MHRLRVVWVYDGVEGSSMELGRNSLVRRTREALRGAALGEGERLQIVGSLHARIKRLQSLDSAFDEVRVSRSVEALLPSALSA